MGRRARCGAAGGARRGAGGHGVTSGPSAPPECALLPAVRLGGRVRAVFLFQFYWERPRQNRRKPRRQPLSRGREPREDLEEWPPGAGARCVRQPLPRRAEGWTVRLFVLGAFVCLHKLCEDTLSQAGAASSTWFVFNLAFSECVSPW